MWVITPERMTAKSGHKDKKNPPYGFSGWRLGEAKIVCLSVCVHLLVLSDTVLPFTFFFFSFFSFYTVDEIHTDYIIRSVPFEGHLSI